MQKNNFFPIFSFEQVDYIFHKLFENTKHVKFQLCMSCGEVLFKMGFKFIFPVISTCSQVAETAQGQGAKKEVCFVHRILVFHFFHFLFSYGFT